QIHDLRKQLAKANKEKLMYKKRYMRLHQEFKKLKQSNLEVRRIPTKPKNIDLQKQNTTTEILSSICCDIFKVECLQRTCPVCKNRHLNYQEFDNSKDVIYWNWKKIKKNYKKNGVDKIAVNVEKVKITVKPLQLIKIFENNLKPFLTHCKEIKQEAPIVQNLIIISDSPSGQYRNKKIFYIMSQLSIYCSSLTNIIWNYSECGHGKGAPDGVGGLLKRTADRFVAHDGDMNNIDSFVNYLKSAVQGVKISTVEEYEVEEKDWLLLQI
ncbi:hypothetical protein HW555_013557, partial [Spodoptera exigua]